MYHYFSLPYLLQFAFDTEIPTSQTGLFPLFAYPAPKLLLLLHSYRSERHRSELLCVAVIVGALSQTLFFFFFFFS